jgi:hypothetical protein
MSDATYNAVVKIAVDFEKADKNLKEFARLNDTSFEYMQKAIRHYVKTAEDMEKALKEIASAILLQMRKRLKLREQLASAMR